MENFTQMVDREDGARFESHFKSLCAVGMISAVACGLSKQLHHIDAVDAFISFSIFTLCTIPLIFVFFRFGQFFNLPGLRIGAILLLVAEISIDILLYFNIDSLIFVFLAFKVMSIFALILIMVNLWPLREFSGVAITGLVIATQIILQFATVLSLISPANTHLLDSIGYGLIALFFSEFKLNLLGVQERIE